MIYSVLQVISVIWFFIIQSFGFYLFRHRFRSSGPDSFRAGPIKTFYSSTRFVHAPGLRFTKLYYHRHLNEDIFLIIEKVSIKNKDSKVSTLVNLSSDLKRVLQHFAFCRLIVFCRSFLSNITFSAF